jgi:RHS repeat-associated protein
VGADGALSLSQTALEGDPVDIATGRVVELVSDLSFRGAASLPLARFYSSERASIPGLFGRGWCCILDQQIRIGPTGLQLQDSEGRVLTLPPLAEGATYQDRREKIVVRRAAPLVYVTSNAGITCAFRVDDASEVATLESIASRGTELLRLERAGALVSKIHDGAGIEYRFVRSVGEGILRIDSVVGGDVARCWTYRFDTRGRLIAVTDPLGNVARYEYDDRDRLRRKSSSGGYGFQYEYDYAGRCVRTCGDDGRFERLFVYAPSERRTDVRNSRGDVTSYYWNCSGLVVRRINPLGHEYRRYYDAEKRPYLDIDETGARSSWKYGAAGSIVRRDAEGRAWTIRYVGQGRETVDPTGAAVREIPETHERVRLEDALGNVRKPPPENRTPAAWASGLFDRLIDPELQAPHALTDAEESLLERDAWRRVIASRTLDGQVVRFRYDANDRLLERIEAGGCSTRLHYDEEGHVVQAIDALGHVQRWRYERSWCTTRVDRNGYRVQFVFDLEGKITRLANERGETHTFTYDAANRLIEECGFDGRRRRYQHDPAGRVVEVAESDGTTIHARWSRTGCLLELRGRSADGIESVNSYAYDAADRLIEATNEHGLVRFEYDNLGRVVRELQDDTPVERGFDAAGNLVYRVSPQGARTVFHYDRHRRLCEVRLPGGHVIRLVRDSAGRIVERHFPGVISFSGYDADGRLISQDVKSGNEVIASRRWEYSARGQLCRLLDGATGEWRYSYDPGGTLTSANRPDGSTMEFEYDPAGNATRRGHEHATYDQGNRIIGWGHNRYEHDARGNLTTRYGTAGRSNYHYNAFNQLVRIDRPDGEPVHMCYDALGRRSGKRSGSQATRYSWDTFQLLEEVSNGCSTEYLFNPGYVTPIAIFVDGTPYFCHTGYPAVVHELTDAEGRLAWRGVYDPTGRCLALPGTSLENRLRYPGQIFDPETGLHQNVFRYYDPETGRYLTQDPLFYQSHDLNLYRYVQNDPINRYDALGLVGAVIVGVGGGLALADWLLLGGVAVGGGMLITQSQNLSRQGCCSIFSTSLDWTNPFNLAQSSKSESDQADESGKAQEEPKTREWEIKHKGDIEKYKQKRKWTDEDIDRTIEKGAREPYDKPNHVTGKPTELVTDPVTGKQLVVDSDGNIIQLGGDGFGF